MPTPTVIFLLLPVTAFAFSPGRHHPSRRRLHRQHMVSERHIASYKESIKLFAPLPPDAPLHQFPLISHLPGPDHGDALIHTTVEPLFSAEECQRIIDEAEAWALECGGWTSKRHFNHPTTDIPLAELPGTAEFLNVDALPHRIYPLLGQAFASLPNWRALRVADAFVVKYDAAKGQTWLSPHRDGAVVSFNVALNAKSEYEGGGTWFKGLDGALPIECGHVCCHASGIQHGGHPITSGVRYILVAFVILEGYQNWAMRYYKSVWDY